MDGTLTRHGKLFGSTIGTLTEAGKVYLLIEVGDGGWIQVLESMESHRVEFIEHRMWHMLEYTRELDQMIVDAVDALADVRYSLPRFRQMRLIDSEAVSVKQGGP